MKYWIISNTDGNTGFHKGLLCENELCDFYYDVTCYADKFDTVDPSIVDLTKASVKVLMQNQHSEPGLEP